MEILDDNIEEKEIALDFKLVKKLSTVFLIAGIILFCIPLTMLFIFLLDLAHISGDEIGFGVYIGSFVLLLGFTLIKVHLTYKGIQPSNNSEEILQKLKSAYWFRNLFWLLAIVMGISSVAFAFYM